MLPLLPTPSTERSGATAPGRDAATVQLRHGRQDTLQISENANHWIQLADALTDARVPMAVGDVAAMRQLAKLDQAVIDALTRWIRTADPQRPAPRTPR